MFVTIIVMTTITSIVLLVLSVINFFKKLVKVMDETKLTTQDSSIDTKETVLKICEDVFSNNDFGLVRIYAPNESEEFAKSIYHMYNSIVIIKSILLLNLSIVFGKKFVSFLWSTI